MSELLRTKSKNMEETKVYNLIIFGIKWDKDIYDAVLKENHKDASELKVGSSMFFSYQSKYHGIIARKK